MLCSIALFAPRLPQSYVDYSRQHGLSAEAEEREVEAAFLYWQRNLRNAPALAVTLPLTPTGGNVSLLVGLSRPSHAGLQLWMWGLGVVVWGGGKDVLGCRR